MTIHVCAGFFFLFRFNDGGGGGGGGSGVGGVGGDGDGVFGGLFIVVHVSDGFLYIFIDTGTFAGSLVLTWDRARCGSLNKQLLLFFITKKGVFSQ